MFKGEFADQLGDGIEIHFGDVFELTGRPKAGLPPRKYVILELGADEQDTCYAGLLGENSIGTPGTIHANHISQISGRLTLEEIKKLTAYTWGINPQVLEANAARGSRLLPPPRPPRY